MNYIDYISTSLLGEYTRLLIQTNKSKVMHMFETNKAALPGLTESQFERKMFKKDSRRYKRAEKFDEFEEAIFNYFLEMTYETIASIEKEAISQKINSFDRINFILERMHENMRKMKTRL